MIIKKKIKYQGSVWFRNDLRISYRNIYRNMSCVSFKEFWIRTHTYPGHWGKIITFCIFWIRTHTYPGHWVKIITFCIFWIRTHTYPGHWGKILTFCIFWIRTHTYPGHWGKILTLCIFWIRTHTYPGHWGKILTFCIFWIRTHTYPGHWGKCLVAWSAPSHYLNQCWLIVNWTPGNKFQWNSNQNSFIFIQENACEIVVRQNGCHFVQGEMSFNLWTGPELGHTGRDKQHNSCAICCSATAARQ